MKVQEGDCGTGKAEGARDGERPAAVALLQGAERVEGEVEGLLVFARGLLELAGLQEGDPTGFGGRRRIRKGERA